MKTPLRPRAGTCRTVRIGRIGRIVAALLALLVSATAVDSHPHGLGEAPVSAGGSSFSHAAVHPGQPLHFEASEIVKRPDCQLCLLRLQTAGIRLVAAASCGVPSAHGAVFIETAPAPSDLFRLSSAARAPPTA